MEWGEALTIPGFSQLAALGVRGIQLDEEIYRVRDQMYFQLVPYDRNYEGEESGPYVTRVIWAESDGAALRAIASKIEMDVVVQSARPPDELLIEGADTYTEIYNKLRRRNPDGIIEMADYRMDGEFIHAILSEGGRDGRKFYFRSNDPQGGDIPYAIAKALSEGRDPITL